MLNSNYHYLNMYEYSILRFRCMLESIVVHFLLKKRGIFHVEQR